MRAFNVRLNEADLEAKIKRIVKGLESASGKTTRELAERGKWMAKFLAPKWSGRTSDFIITRYSPNRFETRIIPKNPTAYRANFNLVTWMHMSNGIKNGRKHIYSGDPRFMFTTKRELNRIKRGVAIRNFTTIYIK
jgi:hypothetical protein